MTQECELMGKVRMKKELCQYNDNAWKFIGYDSA